MKEDLYQKILHVEKPEGQAVNFYVLLNLELFESDGKSIHRAGLEQIKKLKEWQLHPQPEIQKTVQEMLNEISMACSVLEVADKKEGYDKNLANQLNISLDSSYKILTHEAELRACPNCGVKVSQIAIICIDCGYNFRTKRVMQTRVSEAESQNRILIDRQMNYDNYGRSQSNFLATIYAFIFRFTGFSKKTVIIIGIIALIIIGYLIFTRSDSRYSLRTDDEHRSEWVKFIDKSEMFQKYLDYKTAYSSQSPGIAIQIIHGLESDRGHRTHITDFIIKDTETDEELFKTKVRYKSYPKFLENAPQAINSAANECMVKLIGKKEHFRSEIESIVRKKNNDKTSVYLSMLDRGGLPEKEMKSLLAGKIGPVNQQNTRMTALKIIQEKNLCSNKIIDSIHKIIISDSSPADLKVLARKIFLKNVLPGTTWSLLGTVARLQGKGREPLGRIQLTLNFQNNNLVQTTVTHVPEKMDFKFFDGSWTIDKESAVKIIFRDNYASFALNIADGMKDLTGTGKYRSKQTYYRTYRRYRRSYKKKFVRNLDFAFDFTGTLKTKSEWMAKLEKGNLSEVEDEDDFAVDDQLKTGEQQEKPPATSEVEKEKTSPAAIAKEKTDRTMKTSEKTADPKNDNAQKAADNKKRIAELKNRIAKIDKLLEKYQKLKAKYGKSKLQKQIAHVDTDMKQLADEKNSMLKEMASLINGKTAKPLPETEQKNETVQAEKKNEPKNVSQKKNESTQSEEQEAITYIKNKKDVKKGLEILKRLVKLDKSPTAALTLAGLYADGEGVAKNAPVALDYYLQAQELGADEIDPLLQKLFQKVRNEIVDKTKDAEKIKVQLASKGWVVIDKKGYPLKKLRKDENRLISKINDLGKYRKDDSENREYLDSLKKVNDDLLELSRISQTIPGEAKNPANQLILNAYKYLLKSKLSRNTKYLDELASCYPTLRNLDQEKDNMDNVLANIFLEIHYKAMEKISSREKKIQDMENELKVMTKDYHDNPSNYIKSLKYVKKVEQTKSKYRYRKRRSYTVYYVNINGGPQKKVYESEFRTLQRKYENYKKHYPKAMKIDGKIKLKKKQLKKFKEEFKNFQKVPPEFEKFCVSQFLE